MTTAVAPAQNTTLSLWEAPEGGWEDDGNDDILPRFPMIALQPANARNPGKFLHSDTEEVTDSLDIVVLVRRETRALFEDEAEKPICRSDDGRTPAPHQPLWDGRDSINLQNIGKVAVTQSYPPSLCTLCPFSRWGDNGEPPACGNSYILLVDRGQNDLAQLRVKGTSIKPYRDFIASKVTPKGRKSFWFRIKVTSVYREAGPTRKWYEMAFNGSLLSQEEAEGYNAILRAQKARFEETVKAQGEEVEAWVEPDDEPSAWMAELLEILSSVGLTMRDVQAFLPTVKADEANIKGYMARTKLADISEFVAAVEAKFVS